MQEAHTNPDPADFVFEKAPPREGAPHRSAARGAAFFPEQKSASFRPFSSFFSENGRPLPRRRFFAPLRQAKDRISDLEIPPEKGPKSVFRRFAP